MWISRVLLWTTMALAITALLGACGSGSSETASNYVDVDQVDDLTITDSATSPSETTEANFGAVEELVQNFLDLRAQVILNEVDESSLADVASSNAVHAVLAEQKQNDEYLSEGALSAVEQLATWPNIVSIEHQGDLLVVHDCTERQEINSAGQYNVWFVDRTYTLAPVATGATATQLIVANYDTLHDGFLDEEARLGCVPPSFAERAEAAAEAAWSEIIEIARRPTPDRELSSVFSDELGELIAETQVAQFNQGLTLASEENISLTTLGIDTYHGLAAFEGDRSAVVVVESCRQFAEGLIYGDQTGDTTQLASPGDELVQWLYVEIPTVYGSTNPDQVVLIEDHPELQCGESS